MLKNGEYAVLSMISPEGEPYGVPINYVWNGKDAIYMHCAPEGRKLLCINRNARVSLCIIGNTQVISDKFTTRYESIILQGKAKNGLDAAERMDALKIFLQKYSPNDMELGMKYAEKSFHRTDIIRVDIERISGKCKKIKD